MSYVGLPYTNLATTLGSPKAANMIALGAYLVSHSTLDRKSAIHAMMEKFHDKTSLFEINISAIDAGMEEACKLDWAACDLLTERGQQESSSFETGAAFPLPNLQICLLHPPRVINR